MNKFIIASMLVLLGVMNPYSRSAAQVNDVNISGQVIDSFGQPSANTDVRGIGFDGVGDLCCATTDANGVFSILGPAGLLVLSAVPPEPHAPKRFEVDTTNGDVSGLIVQLPSGLPEYLPDEPPRTELISISAPDGAGFVTLTGAAGAVAPNGHVLVANIGTNHAAVTRADESGAFSATLFGPGQAKLLVKTDGDGDAMAGLLDWTIQSPGDEIQSEPVLGMPGTHLLADDVAQQVGAEVPFALSGLTYNISGPLPTWEFRGTISSQVLQPGDPLRITGTATVTANAIDLPLQMQPFVGSGAQRVAAADGSQTLKQAVRVSNFMTPTGLPIERAVLMDDDYRFGLDVQFNRVSPHVAEATVDFTWNVPADAADGYYRLDFGFNFFEDVLGPEPFPNDFFVGGGSAQYLPIVKIGNPGPPKLFWHLLSNTHSNGSRGISALEDQGNVGLVSRIATESKEFVIPRLDGLGRPIAYRLEPFVPMISMSERGTPPAPLIDFKFPSGTLTVEIEKPDGSVQTLGPAPFKQSRIQSVTKPESGQLLSTGGQHPTEIYQLSTMEPVFDYSFDQDGPHIIRMQGQIEDIWGNVWTGGGTYEVIVGQPLSLDTTVLPGMSFQVGDVFSTGLVVSPAVAADVEWTFQLAPDSDSSQMITRTVSGRANRFGYFQVPDGAIDLDTQGEYRADVVARFSDQDGNFWSGSRSWGGVVAPVNPPIIAHGRRGIDNSPAIGPAWFFRTDTGLAKGNSHVPFPFFSGDIAWSDQDDSSVPMITVQDPGGLYSGVLSARHQAFQFDVASPGTLAERIAVGAIPLRSLRPDKVDAHFDYGAVDLFAYSYRSVQRPLVRVRENVAEDIGPLYWRFEEEYGDQIGIGFDGDRTNDYKFQYGAAVIRGPAVSGPLYDIYGSLWVMLPEGGDVVGGVRTFPPFQGNGGGPSGGAIMTLKGRAIDLFVNLRGVRPGSVLEVGDRFSFAGAVAPTLPAKVSYTVTLPDGQVNAFAGQANKVGYYYQPADDFVLQDPGRYVVDVTVIYDGVTSAGQVTEPFPSGGVLGSDAGRFTVYVVERSSPRLDINLPAQQFIVPLQGVPAIDSTVNAPAGMTANDFYRTSTMPGFMLESGVLASSNSQAQLSFNQWDLRDDFPNLDFGGDAITLNVFAEGTDGNGEPMYAARVLTLHGTKLLKLEALDSDADGVPDFEDAFPFNTAETVDTDGDGIGNNADTDDDGDTMPDDYEIANGLDPLNAADASADADGDGFSNLREFRKGTDPQNAADFPDPTAPVSIFILLDEAQ